MSIYYFPEVTMTVENGLHVFLCHFLDIRGYDETFIGALRAFIEEFNSAWDTIVKESDGNLTPDAQLLKHRLIYTVHCAGEYQWPKC